MKKFAATVLSVVLCVALLVSASAETTYVKKYTKEDIAQNTFHSGFVGALGSIEVNTLTLKDDGTYLYVKELHQEDEEGNVQEPTEESPFLRVTYTFEGTYTQDGGTAVLAFPTHVSFSENWGNLAALGYFLNSEGEASFADGEITGDRVKCKEDEGHVPFDLFMGAYLNDSMVTSGSGFDPAECSVTVTLSGDSIDYVVSNSDDD